ncbi:MAG: flagellin [Micavibrio aeruginosavorus]|uniref:Flagellin n=1 Tax=Micavibrio aeruginosavorus TaxID=349221 RepID=A0A7T5R1L6_9BACT|nr:MAG: flagellin [Micavibrio aeruginosavorus]
MTSDVVLTAALRSNLLSLQGTQSAIDVTQFRLSTGRKVNSALDNPQSFFAAQALNNRASDLTRLLDSIGQSIQVIKAADNGVTALTKLVEQADSIATQARDALAGGQSEAKAVGDRDLSGVDDITSLPGVANGDILRFSITDENGEAVNLGAYGGAAGATVDITLNTNDSVDEILSEINNVALQIDGAGNAIGEQAFEATLDEGGNIQIRTLNGGDYRLQFVSAAATDAADLALASDLGFADKARLVGQGGAANNNNVEFTALADVALRSFALYDSSTTPDEIAQRSDLLSVLVDEDGTTLFANIDAGTDDYQIGINGGTLQNIELYNGNTAVTIQDFIDDINSNTTLNQSIVAEFDDETGVLSIRAISADVQSIEVGVAASVATANWGFGLNGSTAGSANTASTESIQLSSAAGELAQLEEDFDNIRSQINLLVNDTGYRGTNLLNGDNLTTYFNEDRSSSLETEGVTFTADGLGISAANFSRTSSVDGSLTEAREALEAVRSFGSALANDLAVIQTRQTFTTELINTLKAGSDALTVADQNEEGAKLLALQTRQQLGVTALSLASQSQQSILRLF